jgi:uncharacterized protein
MRLTGLIVLAGMLGTAIACSPQTGASPASSASSTAPAAHPVSGLRLIPLTVTSQGRVHRFTVEVAASGADQQKGLMFRTAMGADEGMIFPMNPPRDAAFWMRNTVIPLDIIFIGTDRRILNIAANAVPYSEEPLPSDGVVSGVLELNGGRAKALGIGPGDRVDWQQSPAARP